MKMITITKSNIQLIAFHIRQFLDRYPAVSEYSDWGKYPKWLNRNGFMQSVGGTKLKYVECTQTTYILGSTYKMRVDPRYGIIIHVCADTAISVQLGEKIRITPTHTTVKGVNKLLKKSFTSHYAPYFNVEMVKLKYEVEARYSEQYWNDVGEEQMQEQMHKTLEDFIDASSLPPHLKRKENTSVKAEDI